MKRARSAAMRKHAAAWPQQLKAVDRQDWPAAPPGLVQVFRSRAFLVQVYEAHEGATRITVNRVVTDSSGQWRAEITWDELQRLKREAGFGDHWAVEIFPADAAVVNVANMRHLWLLPEAPAFAWKKP